MKVGIYIRVSTQEQANEGYSIQAQTERLTNYCQAKDWIIYDKYIDPGFSGAKMARPALQKLIKDVENKRIDMVLVYKLDRLSRSQKDTLYLIEDVFLPNKVDFSSLNENFDTSTAFGRAMIGILSVFAQLEREQIRERTMMGREARAKNGYFHGGGYSPLGYDYIDGELVINEYEAAQVREIYDLYINKQWPIYRIKKYMTDHYTNKYGGWYSDSSIKSTLTTPIYYGKIQYRGKIYDGQHDSIISEEIFLSAQERLKATAWNNGESRQETPFQPINLLGGLVFCGNCGARYYSKGNYSGRGEHKAYYPYYTCYSRGKSSKRMIRDPDCKNPSWPVVKLDKIILEEIRKLSFDVEYFNKISSGSNLNTSIEDYKKKKIAIENRIKVANSEIERMINLCKTNSLISIDVIASEISKSQEEIRKLESVLDNMERPIVQDRNKIADAKHILSSVSEIIDSDDFDAKREIVHSLIDKVIIYEHEIQIDWSFAPKAGNPASS